MTEVGDHRRRSRPPGAMRSAQPRGTVRAAKVPSRLYEGILGREGILAAPNQKKRVASGTYGRRAKVPSAAVQGILGHLRAPQGNRLIRPPWRTNCASGSGR